MYKERSLIFSIYILIIVIIIIIMMMKIIMHYYDYYGDILYYHELRLLWRYEVDLVVGWVDYGRLVPEPSMSIISLG